MRKSFADEAEGEIGLPRWAWMLPLLLLTAVLAAQGLDADAIWYDELTSIGHAGGLTGPFSPIDVLLSVSERSPKHGPLFFELLAGWASLVGWHHAVLRCLPLFFGLLSIAWVYRIGRDFLDWRSGLWACALLGLNVFWLEYFHEIRMYTVQLAMLSAMLWHYLRVVRSDARLGRRHWMGLIVSGALSLYAQPFSIFVFVAVGFYHVFFVAKTRKWGQSALAFACVGLLYLPWLSVTYRGLTEKFDAWHAMPFAEAVEVFIRLFSNGQWVLLVIPLGVAAYQLRKREVRDKVGFFWILAIVILALLLAINHFQGLIPLRRSRYFLIAFYPTALVLAGGLSVLRPRWLALAIMAAYIASGFVLRGEEKYAEYQGTIAVVKRYPPMQEYVESLRGLAAEEDFIVGFTDAPFVVEPGKHKKSTADYYFETVMGIDGTFLHVDSGQEKLEREVADKLEDHPYLLLAHNPQSVPGNYEMARDIIARDYHACDVVLDGPRLNVLRYVHRSLLCDRVYRPVLYENGVEMVDRFAEVIPERGVVRAVTGWEVAHREQLKAYNVSIQIHTVDGEKEDPQDDRHLYDGVLKWHVAEMNVSALGPGDYRVVAILYDRYPPHGRVSGRDEATGETGSVMTVAEFRIEERGA